MRAVVQRVAEAQVRVDSAIVGATERGLLVLLGIGADDTAQDVAWMVAKIATLRIFPDEQNRFDRSVVDVAGGILLVSQFTLYGDVSRGRRPSFIDAMLPEQAALMVDAVAEGLRAHGLRVETGRFGASMQVSLINDGPVTILLDSATRSARRG